MTKVASSRDASLLVAHIAMCLPRLRKSPWLGEDVERSRGLADRDLIDRALRRWQFLASQLRFLR